MRSGRSGARGTWILSTRLGRYEVMLEGGRIRSLQRVSKGARARRGPATPLVRRLARDLDRVAQGLPVRGRYALDLHGTPFQQRVWRALLSIPRGKVLSYGVLARRLDPRRPGGARAVGQACKANPVAILVPCHRVVAASGIGGYAGTWNAPRKAYLLALEKSKIQNSK